MNISLIKKLGVFTIIGTLVCADALAQSPIRMDIDVSTRRSRQNVGAGDSGQARTETVSLRVRIRQSGGTQSDVPLTAEVYTIGRKIHTGVYLIIDVVKQDFSFADNRLFEFTTRGYPLGFTEGNINVGARYETFLVVVADKDGNILETRSGRSIRDEGIDFIRTLGPRTLFDRDGNVIGEIDDKNQAFRSAAPAAVQ